MIGSLQMYGEKFGVQRAARGELTLHEMNPLHPNVSERFVCMRCNRPCQTFLVAYKFDPAQRQVRSKFAGFRRKSEFAELRIESQSQRRQTLRFSFDARPDYTGKLAQAFETAVNWRCI